MLPDMSTRFGATACLHTTKARCRTPRKIKRSSPPPVSAAPQCAMAEISAPHAREACLCWPSLLQSPLKPSTLGLGSRPCATATMVMNARSSWSDYRMIPCRSSSGRSLQKNCARSRNECRRKSYGQGSPSLHNRRKELPTEAALSSGQRLVGHRLGRLATSDLTAVGTAHQTQSRALPSASRSCPPQDRPLPNSS
jgi:hypothetical protein